MLRVLFTRAFSRAPSCLIQSTKIVCCTSALPISTSSTHSTMLSGTMDNKEEFPIFSDLIKDAMKKMGVKQGYSPIPKDRSHLLQFLPKTQDELPKRSMQDSFLAAVIPLSTDKVLQDQYVTFLGQVRVGRLLENMDMFAVLVAHKHVLNPKVTRDEDFPYVFVTVMVDKIDFTDFIPKSEADIKISGHVSWVGKSSLEIVVWLEQKMGGVWHRITRALFLFAARDAQISGPAIVNAMEPANEREKQILTGGETRQKHRFTMRQKHVTKVIPDANEQKIIHNLYMTTLDGNDFSLRNRHLPPGSVWMSSATLSNVVFSHPQERNFHNTIFGGYIMRQAEELAWVLGYIFSKYRPTLKSISDIYFQKPIAVSSLIQMHAHVVYTSMNYIQVITYVETFNPITGKNDTTNALHFTYQVPEKVSELVPMTYHEAMMYIDGRRHFLEIMGTSKRSFPNKL